MSRPRLEWKVGLFVLLALAMLAGLVVKFSKGTPWFTSHYEILVKTRDVGGIKNGASVMMAGVPVGNVSSAALTPDGREVLLRLRILSQYTIHGDAVFTIEQAGFLGDQFIAITPTDNKKPLLEDGAIVECREPFNLQEAARTAAGFLQRVDQTAQKLNDTVDRLDRTLLSHENLSNLTVTVANFRLFSDKAVRTMDRVAGVVDTNAPGLATGVSNLVQFSEQLDRLAVELQEVLSTNRGPLHTTIQNIDDAAVRVRDVLTNLQAGQGLAGGLLRDDLWRVQAGQTVSNLTVLSSNLARFGLLHKPKAKVEPARRAPLAPRGR